MISDYHKTFSSPESLASTILTDSSVARWFACLAVQPAVRGRTRSFPTLRRDYAELRKALALQCVYLALLAASALLFFVSRQAICFAVTPLLLLGIFHAKKIFAAAVKNIGMRLIEADIAGETLPQKTLYQITETLGETYRLPSLVDQLFRRDIHARAFTIAAVTAILAVVPVLFPGADLPLKALVLVLLLGYAVLPGCLDPFAFSLALLAPEGTPAPRGSS